jgi:hypothetical protein
MSAKEPVGKGHAGLVRSKHRASDPPMLGRKSVLMGMLTSGFVIANAAQPSATAAGTVKPGAIAATTPTYLTKWAPSQAYVRGQQVVSPNNDVVSANVAHTSGSTFNAANWSVSSTYVLKNTALLHSAVLANGTDQTATLNAEIASVSTYGGGIIQLPGFAAEIVCNGTIVLADGVSLVGAGTNPTTGGPTVFNFTSLATGSVAISLPAVSDVGLYDFYVDATRTGATASVIATTGNCRRIAVERVTVNSHTTGSCFDFGTTSDGSVSVIESYLTCCTTAGGAYGFYTGQSCTSINLNNCFAMVSTIAGYHIQGTYIALTGCACDSTTLYGYYLLNTVSVTLTSCGAENVGRTGFWLSGVDCITLIGCRGVSNNTSAGWPYTSFASINDSSKNVTMIGCVDTTPNAATNYSVSNQSGTVLQTVTLINCDLAKGVYPGIVSRFKVGASATQGAGLNVPHGAAPTTPVDGDMWTTTAGMFVRVNGVTKTVTLTQ